MHCSLRWFHLHNQRSEIFSSHPQQSMLLSGVCSFSKISGRPHVLRVRLRVFLSSEHFILFHSGGLSKVSYLVLYLWFLCVFVVVVVRQWTKHLGMGERRCCHVNHTKSDQFDRPLAVAAPYFVRVDVVGGSKSNSILVLATDMLTSVISPRCFLPP